MTKELQYWLMKTEPHVFSLNDLKSMKNQISPWEGVRNYQARNYMKQMNLGDKAFFYHSSCAEPAIVGIVTICALAYPDETSWDHLSPYFDEKVKKPLTPKECESVRWIKVDVQFDQEFSMPVTLRKIKLDPHLQTMKLVQRGQRLSIQPLTTFEFQHILTISSLKDREEK